MKVLYIGGTGEISYACGLESALVGHDVTVLNRSQTDQPLPAGIRQLTGDLESDAAYASLGQESFDSVCQFVAFDSERIDRDWTLTHATDFARPFARLLGNPRALGEAFHITGENVHTWDEILTEMARALGATPELVHIASDTLVRYEPS